MFVCTPYVTCITCWGESGSVQTIKVGSTNIFYCVFSSPPAGPAAVFLKDFTNFLSSIIKLEKVLIHGDFNLLMMPHQTQQLNFDLYLIPLTLFLDQTSERPYLGPCVCRGRTCT